MKLIKLHVGLYHYLRKELKMKKTKKELVIYFRNTAKSYYRGLLRIYRESLLFFDPEFRKQRNEYKKYEKAKKDIMGLIKLLRYSKDKLRKSGVSRQRIRRFFMDVGSRDDDALQKLCDNLMNELGGKG